MNAVSASAPIHIVSTLLHHLDIDQKQCAPAAVPVNTQDLNQYLNDLLIEIRGKPQKREYQLPHSSTQFETALAAFLKQTNLSQCTEADALANRLLRIEAEVERKYGHLAKIFGVGHVKRGSFLQFMYRDGSGLYYLGVKVEHQSFLDEVDFLRKIGLGETQKIYKACRVGFDAQGNVNSVLVFDTNTKPSTYWWHEFWELVQLRTDADNTEQAVTEVCRVLAPLKASSSVDHTLLRNATIAAFKQQGRMDFDDFITKTFASYQPIDPSVSQHLSRLVEKMRQLPEVKRFDSQFELDPKAVPFRRVTVPLTEEISLSYEAGMPHLEDKIWASRTHDGKNVLIIEAPQEATQQFTFKAMD